MPRGGKTLSEQSLSMTTFTRVYIDISPENAQRLNIEAATLRTSKKALLQKIIGDYFDGKKSKK